MFRQGRSEESRARNLRQNGATAEEAAFLLTRRVELNALASDALVAFIERKLKEHGIEKVVPDEKVLAEIYRANVEAEQVKAAIQKALRGTKKAAAVKIPDGLARRGQRLTSRAFQHLRGMRPLQRSPVSIQDAPHDRARPSGRRQVDEADPASGYGPRWRGDCDRPCDRSHATGAWLRLARPRQRARPEAGAVFDRDPPSYHSSPREPWRWANWQRLRGNERVVALDVIQGLKLSDWERDFTISIAEQLRGNPYTRLTPKAASGH